MKRMTYRFREWLRRRALNEQKRKCSRLRPRRAFGAATFSTLTNIHGTHLVQVEDGDRLPAALSFRDEPEETLRFFANLRTRTLSGKRSRVRGKQRNVGWIKAYSDFKSLHKISPSASLVLAAEYDRVQRVTGAPSALVDIDRWDPDVVWTLRQLGFFDLFGISDASLPDPPLARQNFLVARMQWGDDVNFVKAGKALVDLFTAAGGSEAARVSLLGAVVDAIENVRAHAYEMQPDALNGLIPPFWWVSGSADSVARSLTLSIYDQGATIPVTLPNRWPIQFPKVLRSLFGAGIDPADDEHDGHALMAAMQLSKTSSGRPERGLGLAKIKEAVANSPGGRLRVISRRGHYEFKDGSETCGVNGIPLGGTLVDIEATF